METDAFFAVLRKWGKKSDNTNVRVNVLIVLVGSVLIMGLLLAFKVLTSPYWLLAASILPTGLWVLFMLAPTILPKGTLRERTRRLKQAEKRKGKDA